MPNFDYPSWLAPKTEPWQALVAGAQVGNMIAQSRYRNQAMKLQVEQQAQQDVLRMRELAMREQQMTMMNQARLNQMEEWSAELADVPLLHQYAQNPDAGVPEFKSPKSYQRLGSIDLARSRSDAGKQTAADQTDFNKRLLKVSAEDRALIRDMQRKGTPEAEIWGILGAAERTEQDRLLASKREMTDYQKAQVDLRERRMEMDLEKFDAQNAVTLKKLGFTEERLALDRERLKSGKAFAPTEIKKLYDEATEWDLKGMHEEAEVSRQRAKTLANPGTSTGTLSKRVRAQALAAQYRLGEIDKAAYDAELDKLFPESPTQSVTPTLRFDPSTNSVAPIK